MMLVEMSKLPAWIPIIVLAREFLVSGYRLIAVEKGGKVIAASKWGKLKTVTQMIAIILAFIDLNAFGTCFTRTFTKWRIHFKFSSNNYDDSSNICNYIFRN